MKFLLTQDGPFHINVKYNWVKENHKLIEINSMEEFIKFIEGYRKAFEDPNMGIIGISIVFLDEDDKKAVKEYYGENIEYEIESYGVCMRR